MASLTGLLDWSKVLFHEILGLAAFCLSLRPHRERLGFGRRQMQVLFPRQAAVEWRTHTPCLDGFYTLGLGKAVAENIEQNKLQNIEGMQAKS